MTEFQQRAASIAGEQFAEHVREIEQLRAALLLAQRLCSEALPKFNWGASILDANAIKLLNDVPLVITRALGPNAKAHLTLYKKVVLWATCMHTKSDGVLYFAKISKQKAIASAESGNSMLGCAPGKYVYAAVRWPFSDDDHAAEITRKKERTKAWKMGMKNQMNAAPKSKIV